MTQKIDSGALDVIVIGAGPAGASTARELSKLGKKVLLIERSQEIGEPNYSTAGTPKETVEEFELPETVLSSTWNKILFASPRVQAEWKYDGIAGYVFDFSALRKFLAEDAANHGAEIMIGTAVEEFIEDKEGIKGIRYHGALGQGEAFARVIVDATGHNELANTKLKINPLENAALGDAMEYVMTKIPSELKDTLAFYVGSGYAHRGYSWVFPMSKNTDAKVGTCSLLPLPKNKKLDDILASFIENLPFFENMEPTEIHAGAARADGGVKNHVYKNVVLVGDSAHQINPLAGEDIRHALSAGRLAAGVIHNWLDKNSDKIHILKTNYEKQWHNKFAHAWKLSRLLIKNAVNFNDHQWDKFLTEVKKITPPDFYDLFFHYKHSVVIRYPSIAKELVKLHFQK